MPYVPLDTMPAPGTLLFLVSGSPGMTVIGPQRLQEGGRSVESTTHVRCIWHDFDAREFKERDFDFRTLTQAPDPEG